MIKLFPTKKYLFVLENENRDTWRRLKENTQKEMVVFPQDHKRLFIGEVGYRKFRLEYRENFKSTTICIDGDFHYKTNNGTLKVRLQTFRPIRKSLFYKLFINLIILSILLFLLRIFLNAGFINSMIIISIFSLVWILLRFMHLITLKNSSKAGLQRLKEILEITELKEIK